MEKQAMGKIFLADERGVVETLHVRRYSTFNFGSFIHEHKAPVGSLYRLNEEYLAGSQQIELTIEEPSHVIIIPVTGEVKVRDAQGSTSAVDVGEIQIHTIPAHDTIYLANPYENHTITFLQIAIKAAGNIVLPVCKLFTFSFTAIENQLAPIVGAHAHNGMAQAYPFTLHIGRFDGRREAVYELTNKIPHFLLL